MNDALTRRAERAYDEGGGWAGLAGDALAFVLSRVMRERGALVVVDEPDRAEQIERALRVFIDEPGVVESYPCDDVRPYDGFSPSPEVVGQRMRVLHKVGSDARPIVVAPVRALLARVPDHATRERGTLRLSKGDLCDRDDVIARLTATGYLATPRVERPGTYAARGDVLDVWSVGVSRPVRLDWLDDEIESIRALDVATGRAGRSWRATLVLPAREERVDADAVSRLAEHSARAAGSDRQRRLLRRRMVEEVRAGVRPSAIEDWLPALVETQAPLATLGRLPIVCVHPASVEASAREAMRTAIRRYGELDDDERPLVTPAERLVAVDELITALGVAFPVYELSGAAQATGFDVQTSEGLAVHGADLAPVVSKLRALADNDVRVGIYVPDARRGLALEELFGHHGLELAGRVRLDDVRPGEVSLLVGDLPRGFVAANARWALVPATALFGQRASSSTRANDHRFDVRVSHVGELRQGDLVVHKLHGIGRYEGLVRLDIDGAAQDLAKLIYRGDDVLYVPVTGLDQLSRYATSGDPDAITLDKLGGQTWAVRTGKVRDQLLKSAMELMGTAARRELVERAPHPPIGDLYRTFEARFPFTETVDQARAIAEIHEDLSGDQPMDRLLCGDVGFGKTEVALRAAMRVVEGGRQVMFLCPTTVLAFQHQLTLAERFADLPVRIGMLSRFTPPAEARRVRDGLADGSLDIVVGTHALLGRDIKLARPGLVVIDEEHRFGVKQKERLKRFRAEIDVLAMSATPIPRTLQMALSGIRPMSVMTTAPVDRLEVRTSVARFTVTRVRDALLAELERGGQAFIVHNRIEDIAGIAETVAEWVPEARIRVAHGRLSAEALESLYLDFVKREFDVLVATTIIETGVDLPNVNTILIHNADRYGLGQLYQLRGRVGRGAVRGTCLLMVGEEIAPDARRRLGVLVENTRLGSGFAIASADLELRGGGNLLGEAQSGNIDAVGYHVWVELLEEAIALARGQADRARIEPEIEVASDAFIPEEVVPDMGQRMGWYRRFAGARREQEVERLLEELEGLYGGELPVEAHHLGGKIVTTLLCRELGIARVSWLKIRVRIELHPQTLLTPAALERLVAAHPNRFEIKAQSGAIGVRFTPSEAEKPWIFLRWVLARLSEARAA